MDAIVKAVIGAVAGSVIGWAATALTLVGRVSAIEASQARIEQTMVQVLTAVKAKP